MEKAKVTLDRGGEMSLVYGVPDEFPPGDPTCLVFAHGAGGPMYSPFLTYFHTELAKHGFLTVKFNFPYMEARKKTTDKKDVLEAAYRKIVEEVKSSQYKPDRLFFLVYPLHPPGRLDRLRDEHLYKITRPMLFVSGTRDSFGTRELLEKVLSRLGSKASVHWVEEGDHSFNTPEGKSAVPKTYETVVRVLVDWAQTSA